MARLLLDQLPTDQRERFAGWCAEVVLVSDRLWAADPGQGERLTVTAARSVLAGASIEVVHVREQGDPAHGTPCPPCRSCRVLLDALGVHGPGTAAPATGSRPNDPGGGSDLARRWALMVAAYAAPDGRHHEVVDAAVDAYHRYGGERREAPGGGVEVAASGYVIDPSLALPTVTTLAAVGAAIGARMSPLGIELGGPGFLAVDEHGRLFVIDHTAEWFLGETVEQGLDTLLAGRAPRRVRTDGTW